ncbi:MAG: tetratricopeptide repeat protein [Nanoarchaeota archaeon]
MTLEDTLMDDIRAGKQVDIERALLIGSGCDTEERISEYRAKLDELERQADAHQRGENLFAGSMASAFFYALNPDARIANNADALDKFLWQEKPASIPYRIRGIFRPIRFKKWKFLPTEAIDAQLLPKAVPVGNCLSLSSLYAMLGTRKGLDISVLYNSRHALLQVDTGQRKIAIECTSPCGFGINIEESRLGALKEGGPPALVAFIYTHRGHAKLRESDLQGAMQDYEKHIEILPDDADAHMNLAIARYEAGMFEEAAAGCTKAIELGSDNPILYRLRSDAKRNLGNMQEAKADFVMYRKLKGESQ